MSLGNGPIDNKWGRFLPSCRWNGDQVPVPFVCAPTETYKEKGAKRVWIAQMEEGMTKRFCTLHVVFRAEGSQPELTIIFRGQGLRISCLERESWDSRVNLMFQKKAWADCQFILQWAEKHFCPFLKQNVPPQLENVYFCDNLDAQLQQGFLDLLKSVNCFRWLLPKKSTSETQPVDAGLGRLVKFFCGKGV